jgi:hypothetical protein
LWLGQCTAPAIEMDPHCTPASGRISAAASFRALDVLTGATLRRRRVVPSAPSEKSRYRRADPATYRDG